MRARVRVLLALAFALLAVSASVSLAASASSTTVNRDRAVGPLRIGNGTLSQATAAYGTPTSIHHRPSTCIARWRPLRLSMQFLSFDADPCTSGVLVFATAASSRWKTDRGLRVGARKARLLALYPNAKAKPDGRWLITRRACQDVGGQLFPGLKAQMGGTGAQRRVTALVVSANVCE
jgi:hypothetical protein